MHKKSEGNKKKQGNRKSKDWRVRDKPEKLSATKVLGCFGIGVSLLMVGGPLASAKTVVEERNTRSLPFGFTCCLAANATLWALYGYMVHDPMIYVPNIMGVLVSLIQLSLFAVFGIHSAENKQDQGIRIIFHPLVTRCFAPLSRRNLQRHVFCQF